MTPLLDVIVVNWHAGEQLLTCLRSVLAAEQKGYRLDRVIVIDNASSDGSIDRVEALCPSIIRIRNTENRGFAAACNQGAVGSRADFILFLNPDTRLFSDTLCKPIVFLDRPEKSDVGVVGVQLVDDAGHVHRSCARFPTAGRELAMMLGLDRLAPRLFTTHFMTEWDHSDSREVEQVMGAFFLVRRAVFEALDGFDERFFVYFEDVDFALRARRRGWRSFYLATAHAYHRGGGTSAQAKDLRLFYALRSRIRYCFKHFGWVEAALVTAATLLVEPVCRVAWALVRRSPDEALDTLRAYARLWREVPTLLGTA